MVPENKHRNSLAKSKRFMLAEQAMEQSNLNVRHSLLRTLLYLFEP